MTPTAPCPHIAGEPVGPSLPDPLPYAATYCPRCRVWIRTSDPVRPPRQVAPDGR